MTEVRNVFLSQVLLPPISGGRPAGGINAKSEGVPSLGGENIKSNGGMKYDDIRIIPEAFYDRMPKGKLQPLDVLINKDGAQTGKVGLYDGAFEKAAVNEHLFILRAQDREETDQAYLFYCVLLPETQQKIYRRITGSAQPGLNSQFVRAVDIPFHTPLRQQKIARILQTIDRAIEKTEALIEKYQQIKAGLMHDLFTRGIGPDGQLRPPREQAPELYQETPIGWIPKEWHVQSLGELCSQIADCPHSTPTYRSSGIPCIRTADMLPGKLDLDKAYCVDEHDYLKRIQRLKPREGDVIYSREGERLGIASPVGREPVCLGQRVMILRPSESVDASFLLWMMNHDDFYLRVTRGLGATTSPHVNIGDIQRMPVFVPDLSEQAAIGMKLSSVQAQLDSEKAIKDKMDKNKYGLMHDLLTGKVPVQVEPEEEPEVAHV